MKGFDALAHSEKNYDCRSRICSLLRKQISQSHRERNHELKAFSFSEMVHFDHQRAHSESRYWFQWLAVILSPILANFVWIARARLLNGGGRDSGLGWGDGAKPNKAKSHKVIVIKCLGRNRKKQTHRGYPPLNQTITAISAPFFGELLPSLSGIQSRRVLPDWNPGRRQGRMASRGSRDIAYDQ
jgi:hypothetical protein